MKKTAIFGLRMLLTSPWRKANRLLGADRGIASLSGRPGSSRGSAPAGETAQASTAKPTRKTRANPRRASYSAEVSCPAALSGFGARRVTSPCQVEATLPC